MKKLPPEGWFLVGFASLVTIIFIISGTMARIWDAIEPLVYFIIVVLAIVGAYHLLKETRPKGAALALLNSKKTEEREREEETEKFEELFRRRDAGEDIEEEFQALKEAMYQRIEMRTKEQSELAAQAAEENESDRRDR